MSYLNIFTAHNLALISDWLDETGELYIDIQLPHSGGSGVSYFIRSLQDLKELVIQQTWHEIIISIYHHCQYPLRGIINDDFIEKALHEIRDGEWYAIVSLKDFYPAPCSFLGSGNNHAELRQELEELMGQQVAVGKNPSDYYHDEKWFVFHHDDVFQVSVRRNQSYYDKFVHNPDKYESILNRWQK